MLSPLHDSNSLSERSDRDFPDNRSTASSRRDDQPFPVPNVTIETTPRTRGEEAHRSFVEDIDDFDRLVDHESVVSEPGLAPQRKESWWIDFMRTQGLLKAEDTDTVFGDEEETKKGEAGARPVHLDPDETFLTGGPSETDLNDSQRLKDASGAINGEAGDQGDSDDNSEDDESDDDSDWKERLWVVARNHWNDLQSSPEEAEMLMLSARDEDEDRQKAEAFRSVLLSCLGAYVQVFGDIDVRSQKKKSSHGENTPLLVSEATKLSAFVPFRVARRLFHAVLLDLQSREDFDAQHQKSAEEQGAEDDVVSVKKESFESIMARKKKDPNFLLYAGHVTEVILSPDLDVFRTYIVEPTADRSFEDQGIGDNSMGLGRRVRTNRISDDRRRFQDVEQLIYGDMYVEEEKKDDTADEVQRINGSDEPDIDEEDGSSDHEEEVRLRSGVAKQIIKLASQEGSERSNMDWRLPFLREVLLNGLLKDSLSSNQLTTAQMLTTGVDRRSETSLSYMYSIRYFPHFYLRASWNLHATEKLDNGAFSFLMKYFSDPRLIRNRLVVLGVYNGVMMHVDELNSLFEELRTRLQRTKDCDEMYRDVHRSIAECLSAILEENLRSVGFAPTKADDGTTIWKPKNNQDTLALESDHAHVVSVCLEIGRSFHFQGVTLGRREQERLEHRLSKNKRSLEASLLPKQNFDDDMTELEVAAYLSAQSAYNGALSVLRSAEASIRSMHRPKQPPSQAVNGIEQDRMGQPPLPPTMQESQAEMLEEQRFQTSIKHIVDARATIELYLADSLTTLGYCYEAKLTDCQNALPCYSKSLDLYAQHVSRDHPTILHTLQSIGSIHIELKRWQDALSCFNECIARMTRKDVDPEIAGQDASQAGPTTSLNDLKDIASTLKSLGIVRSELGQNDGAFDSLSASLNKMNVLVARITNSDLEDDTTEEDVTEHETFLCNVMSKMVDVLFSKLSQIKMAYSKRRLAMVYNEDERFDLNATDGLRLTRLQVERKAVEIARDTVALRARLLKIPDVAALAEESVLTSIRNRNTSEQQKLPKWYEIIDYVKDLVKLGKLYFRRADHSDAVKLWKEALFFIQQGSDPDGALYDDISGFQGFSRIMQEATGNLNVERISIMSEVAYLTGVALCRLGDNEAAVANFEKAMTYLEYKRKLLRELVQSSMSDEEWEVLDLDLGYCEHALGLARFYLSQFTPATTHYREALRLFEAVAARRKARQAQIKQGQRGRTQHGDEFDDPERPREMPPISEDRRGDLDVSVNAAIASVMLSLGALYHEQRKSDRALRFLDGAIQIIESTTHKVLSMERDPNRTLTTTTGFNDLSLVLSIVRVGDAHRRIALMHLERRSREDAKVSFETSMKYLESTNLEARLTLSVDDEKYLETISQNDISDMLLNCYDNLMAMMDQSREERQRNIVKSSSWFGFGGGQDETKEDPDALDGTGLTREDLLFRLGNVHAKRSDYDAAIQCFYESRDLTEDRLLTSEHQIIGNIMFNLGNVYKSIYQADKERPDRKARESAVESFGESLRIARIVSGPDAIAVAEVMESLSSLHMGNENDYTIETETTMVDDAEAVKLLREAISIRKMYKSDTNLAFAQDMHFLGMLCLKQYENQVGGGGKLNETKLLDESIACLSQAHRVRKLLLGDHLEVANSSHYLGVALKRKAAALENTERPCVEIVVDSTKRLEDALFIRNLFLERSVREAKRPGNSGRHNDWRHDLDGVQDVHTIVLRTAENIYEIALVHEQSKRFENERLCLRDALDLLDFWSRDPGGDEPWRDRGSSFHRIQIEANRWRAQIFHSLGVSWFEEGDFERAVSNLERALQFRGVDTLDTETPDEVFDTFFRNRNPGRQGRITSSLESAFTMEKLGGAYGKLNRADDSLRCYTYALRVFGEHYGDESLKVADVLKRIGTVYQEGHDYKRCVRALQRALHIRDMFEEADALPSYGDALVFVQLARALMAIGAYDQVALDHFYSAAGMLEEINQHQSTMNPFRISSVTGVNLNVSNQKAEQRATNELLLECHSSILVLIRRGGTDVPNDEERVCEVLHRIGNTQAALGKYETALKSLQHVMKFQRHLRGDEHLSVADLLFNLGNIYVEMEDLESARKCHQDCHGITSEALGEESVELAENMICLGNVEYLCNNFTLALDWFDDALRLLRERNQFEVSVCKVLLRKAISFDKLGEYSRSIECFGEVLKLSRKLWGPNHPELSSVLNSLGNVHRNQGEIRRALRCYEECLRIRIQADDELGVANTKNNIGAIFASLEHVERSRQFYADSLRVKTEILGSVHIDTARTLYNMGQLYVTDRQFKFALDFLEEALRVFKLNLGENHNEVAACLCSIGTVHDETTNEELALSYFKRALNAVKGQGGSRAVKAQALHNVGIILTKRNDIDHAVRIFREALEMKQNSIDAEDKSDTQYSLANVLRLTGCTSEAMEYHKAALDARLQLLGPENASVADSLFGFGQTLVDNNEHKDALAVLRQCRRIQLAIYGNGHDKVADTLFLLGMVLREFGSLSESFSCLKQAVEIKCITTDKHSKEVADISFKLAIVLVELGKFEEAKTHTLKCLQIRLDKLGDVHPEVATAMENMGIIEQKLGKHQDAIEWMKKALEIKHLSVGDQHEDISAIVHTMALSLGQLDDLDSAVQLFEDAVSRKKATYGQKHIEVARVLVDQGHLLERVDDPESALMCYEEAVDTDCFEDNSWEIGRVFMRMGIAHFTLEKEEDSWDCLSEAARVFELIERREKRRQEKVFGPTERPNRDLRDLIRCYECMLRLSEANPVRYSVDRSLVLPKVGHVLAEIKQYKKATSLYKDAVVIQKSLPGDTRFVVATNLHNLGNCLHHLGDVDEAMICLEDALGLFQEIPGVEGKHVADTYHSLGVVHQAKSELQEALACFSNALKSRRNSTDRRVDLVSTLSNMGHVLRTLGMYDAAIKSCKDALRLVDTNQDSTILVVARIVECIGSTQQDRFEYEKALRCYRECLKQRREAPGENYISVAKTLHSIGTVLSLQGQKEEAAKSFRESLDIIEDEVGINQLQFLGDAKAKMKTLTDGLRHFVEKQHGISPLDGADILVLLGSLLERCDRFDEAIVSNEIAVKFFVEALGSDHLLTAEVKHRLGMIRFKLGEYDRATPHLREALLVRRQKLGDKHHQTEDTIKTLARTYAAIGDSEMALTYFKEIMRKDRSVSKDMDGEADLLLRLGKLHLEQNEFAEALVCLRDSLKVQRQGGPDQDDFKLGDTLQCMGSALLDLNQYQEARITLLSALKVLEATGESDSEALLSALLLLGRVNEEEDSLEKALAWYEKGLKIVEGMEEPDVLMKARVTYRLGMVKFSANELDEAMNLLLDAKDLLNDAVGPNHVEYANCIHSIGRMHFFAKELTKAKECFQTSLTVRQQHLNHNDLELADSLHSLGACLLELGQLGPSQSCLQDALKIRKKSAGRDDEDVGDSCRCLALVEFKLGKRASAMENFQEAIRIGMNAVLENKQPLPEGDYNNLASCFDAAITMAKNNDEIPEKLGKLYHQQGSLQSTNHLYRKAMSSFTEAIQYYKMVYGDEHLSVANALFNVGVCLKEIGDTDRAMKCFTRALHITKQQLGDDHTDVADTLQQMSQVYSMKGDIRGALKMCEQALQIRRYKEDLALAALLDFTGDLCCMCKDGEEAERSFRECVRIRRKVHGDDHLDVSLALFSLGRVYETFRRDYKRSLRCYEEALRIRKISQGDDSVESARGYLHLGNVHALLHNDKKATFCFHEATQICIRSKNPKHEVVEDAIVGQGQALVSQGKHGDALEQYARAQTLRTERIGKEESAEIADIRVLEAEALERSGRKNDALKLLLSTLDMYKITVGIEHLGTAGCLHRLAEVYFELGEGDEAMSYAQQALKIRKNLLSKNDEAVGDSYFVIGKVFMSHRDLDTAKPCLEAAHEIFRHSRKTTRDDQLRVANVLYHLGIIHEARRNWQEAVSNFRGALPARQKVLGWDHPQVAAVLDKLGKAHGYLNEFDLGAECFQECLRIQTLVYGSESVQVADALYSLGSALKEVDRSSQDQQKQQQHDGGDEQKDPSQCLADAIRIYRELLGENEIPVAKCLARLGSILQASKQQHNKAGGCFERSVSIFDSKLREDPTREEVDQKVDDYEAYAAALLDYAKFLDAAGRDGSAMKTYRRALKLYQLLRGRDHDIIGKTLCCIANVLGRQERFSEAMQLYGEVLKRRVSTLGDNHPMVADVYFGMAMIFEKKRDFHAAMSSLEKCVRIRRATVGPWSEDVAEVLLSIGMVQKAKDDFSAALQSWDEALAIYRKAGLSDNDPAILTLLKNQSAAKAMLESMKD